MGDKKKRGESGQRNAENIPFRNGGSKCNLSTSHGRSDRVDRARFLTAMAMGAKLPGFTASDRMYRWADEAMAHCTVDRQV